MQLASQSTLARKNCDRWQISSYTAPELQTFSQIFVSNTFKPRALNLSETLYPEDNGQLAEHQETRHQQQ
jgi:hypothetical protein